MCRSLSALGWRSEGEHHLERLPIPGGFDSLFEMGFNLGSGAFCKQADCYRVGGWCQWWWWLVLCSPPSVPELGLQVRGGTADSIYFRGTDIWFKGYFFVSFHCRVKRFLPFPSQSLSPALCPSSSQTPSDSSWAGPHVYFHWHFRVS